MKFHKVCSILAAAILGYLILVQDQFTRMLLAIPVLVLFYVTLILFGLEMEKQKRKNWDSKKDKLIEEIYSDIISEYYKRKIEPE